MKPMTLRGRVDEIAHDLFVDDKLFSSVLDRYIEKSAEACTPKEVLRIAEQVERETGLSKEAALHTAWETYLRYVNPDFVKEGGKIPPQFMKSKGKGKGKGEEKDEKKGNPFAKKDGDEKSEKSEDKKDEKKDDEKEEEKDGKKPFPFKSAAAIELAEKLGMKHKCSVMTKEAPKSKKMVLKTAAAIDLAKALGV